MKMNTIESSVTNFFSLDVEADGPCPGLYSMLSLGLVSVENPDQSFYATFRPISDRYIPEALSKSKFTREQSLNFAPAERGIHELDAWLTSLNLQSRPIVWSDNPAFDWQFLNYYCHLFLGNNPFSTSARRIGDFYAGLQHNARATTQWKRLRLTKHSHNAEEDARGNAEALRTIFGHPNPIS